MLQEIKHKNKKPLQFITIENEAPKHQREYTRYNKYVGYKLTYLQKENNLNIRPAKDMVNDLVQFSHIVSMHNTEDSQGQAMRLSEKATQQVVGLAESLFTQNRDLITEESVIAMARAVPEIRDIPVLRSTFDKLDAQKRAQPN